MGQRLNVEIWSKGKVLANAYYHWSAYTSSAAEIVDEALKFIKDNPDKAHNDLLYAIRVLEATGAGLTDQEVEHAKTTAGLTGASFAECQGRNLGLIAISESGISETRWWSEGAVFIYLDEKRISFKVFFTKDKWEWEKEQREEYEREDANAKNLDVYHYNFDDIKFRQWNKHKTFLTSCKEPFICDIDRTVVLETIW